MDQVPEAIVGVAAFIGIALLGFAIFGRPDQSLPRCSQCRADARRFARNSPMLCECGAALDRPGAVRTKGRVRRWGFAIAGIVVWIAAIGLTLETIRERAIGTSWVRFIPIGALIARSNAGDEWAVDALHERSLADDLSPEDAGALLREIYEPSPNTPKISGHMAFKRWSLTRPDAARMIPLMSHYAAKGVHWEGDDLVCELGPTISLPEAWLLRIERVSIGGRELSWSLTVAPLYRSGSVGTRAFLGTATLRVIVPRDDRPIGPVELDALIVASRGAAGMACDPRVNGSTPPTTWPVKSETAPVSIAITLPAAERKPTP